MKTKLLIIILIAAFLRLYRLDQIPVSLFGDELDVGYQAYSIVQTGKDYYGNSWPIHFHSLAEYRTPLYLYSAVPTVKIFGISPLGVRLPAAIFGILTIPAFYFFIKQFKKTFDLNTKNSNLELIASMLLAISPWHIQYSRAAFEVTELLFFLILALTFFFKSFKNSKYLIYSSISFAITIWIYSTAKVFIPLLLASLVLIFYKDLLKISRKILILSLASLILISLPIYLDTQGATRFNYISVMSDPTTESEIGTARLSDARVRGLSGTGISPSTVDRIFHNKYVLWSDKILNNYFQSFSTNFLFNEGDPNLRHSIKGVGQMYKADIIGLIIGLIVFFAFTKSIQARIFIASFLLLAAFPSALTRDGGNHATRLIIMLPSLMFLTASGISYLLENKNLRYLFAGLITIIYSIFFISYQHLYWVHDPWDSERWWHAGFEQSFKAMKSIQGDYDRIIISTANEPPWVFFAAWYEYDPTKWQNNFPTEQKINLKDFGEVSYIDKFYFATSPYGLYELGKVLDEKTLYLATEKEVKVNLITEPERLPRDLKLIKAIAYPSGEPAYYLFTLNKQ